jgi:hypothetical protein
MDFFNDYFNNPYFLLDNNRTKYSDANITGAVDVTYKLNNWLNITEQIGVQQNTRNRKELDWQIHLHRLCKE